MTAPTEPCHFAFEFHCRPDDRVRVALDPDDLLAAAEPVPQAGVLRLLAPPPSLYVALRHARLVDASNARFAMALGPLRAIGHGDAACEAIEQDLEFVIAMWQQAIEAQAARMRPVGQVLGELLTANAELGGHRRVLAGFQRALHRAPNAWDVLGAVRAELAPWRAGLQAIENTLVGHLAANFSFLPDAVALFAGCADDAGLFVDVVYALQGSTFPPRASRPEPWLTLGFDEAMRKQSAHARPVCGTWARMDRDPAEGARHG